MTTQDIKHLFHVNDLRLMPEAIMSVITGDKEHRDEVYKELLSINGHDLYLILKQRTSLNNKK